MNTVIVYYKRKEWVEWVSWPCQNKEEAERVKQTLKEQGYEVKS